jgi:hypothetical protein
MALIADLRYREFNYSTLANWNMDINAELFDVLRVDIEKGQSGKIHTCPAAEALKRYFGNDCVPSVKEGPNGLYMEVSDHKNKVRYHADLRMFADAFSPERFDQLGILTRPGPLLIQNVVAKERPVDKHPPNKNRSRDRSKQTARKPRSWSKARMELRAKDTSIRDHDTYVQQKAMSVLSGDVAPSVDLFS